MPRKSRSDIGALTEDVQRIQTMWADYGEVADDRVAWKSCAQTRGKTKVCW